MEFSIENLPIHLADDDGIAGPSEHFSDSDSDDVSDDIHAKKKKRRVVASKLPPHLKGLMGEANLRFARGDLTTAKKMCYEVIRNCPDAYEPYLTLSQMYENTNLKKYKGYLLLASHMFPYGVDIVCRLADIYLQENLPLEAIACYTRALKASNVIKNMDLHYKRLAIVEKFCDHKHVLRCKQTIANHLPKRQHENIIKICMDVAKDYFSNKNYIKAIEVLDIPFKRVPTKITGDVLNMMLECLLCCDKLSECLDILLGFCGFEFEIFVDEDQKITINSYTIPNNIQVDLKTKFVLCVVKLKSTHLIPAIIDSIIFNDDVEVYGDLYLDIVEVLMPLMPEEALKLLVPLVKSKNFSLAAIWLKHAECLSLCNMWEQAIEAYFTVMALAPQHVEVLYPLAMLLLKQNKQQEALDVLSLDLTTNKIDVAVLMERLKILREIGAQEEYWKSAELLLSRHCAILKNPQDLKVVTTGTTIKEKLGKLKKIRLFCREDPDVESHYVSIREPEIAVEYEFYRDMLQYAKDQGNYPMFQKFSFMGLCSKRFQKYFNEIFISAFYACILNRDTFHGYSLIRDILVKLYMNNTRSNLVWNWFNTVVQAPDDCRHIRFLERYQNKFIGAPIKLIEANYDVAVGNYMAALTYFMQEYKATKSAYSTFMLGVVLLQLYSQKYHKDKKKLLAETATYLFINYSKTRSKQAEQEIFYNLGRMYQQLGVTYLAEFYYLRVLKVENDLLERHPEILCLKREAAFNLHIIYMHSGNRMAARNVILQNIVV